MWSRNIAKKYYISHENKWCMIKISFTDSVTVLTAFFLFWSSKLWSKLNPKAASILKGKDLKQKGEKDVKLSNIHGLSGRCWWQRGNSTMFTQYTWIIFFRWYKIWWTNVYRAEQAWVCGYLGKSRCVAFVIYN